MIGGFIGKPIGGLVIDGNGVLTAVTGSYTITGVSVSFADTLPAAAGSYALTGNAITFNTDEVLATGSYALTGNAASFIDTMPESVGSYTLTGNAVTFQTTEVMTVGAYALTGNATLFLTSMPAATGSYVLTGNATVFGATIPASVGTYVLTGSSLVTLADVIAAAGAYRLQAPEPILISGYIGVGIGGVVVQNYTGATKFAVTMPAAPGAYGLTGYPVSDVTDTIDSVLHLRGGGSPDKGKRRGKAEVRLAPRTIAVADSQGRTRKVDYLKRFAPLQYPPAWAVPKTPEPAPTIQLADELMALPAPRQLAQLSPGPTHDLIADYRDEDDLMALADVPDPLIDDIERLLVALHESGALEHIMRA